MESTSSPPLKFFYCYDHNSNDQKLLKRLKTHLEGLRRTGCIASEEEARPGDDEEKIRRRLEIPHIILLLVSPDFVASPSCVSQARWAMERYKRGESVRVIPVLLRSANVDGTPLRHLREMLPLGRRAVASWRRHKRDTVFQEIARGIGEVVEDLQNQLATENKGESIPAPGNRQRSDQIGKPEPEPEPPGNLLRGGSQARRNTVVLEPSGVCGIFERGTNLMADQTLPQQLGHFPPTVPVLPSPPPPRRSRFLPHALTAFVTIMLTLLIVFFAVRWWPWLLPSNSVQVQSHAQAQSSACRLSRPTSPQSTKVIKIGVELPLSGYDVHDGKPLLNAIELATTLADAKNDIPGYTLEVYACDDVSPNTHQHDPSIGASNIATLARDPQVAAIIGPFNSDVAIDELHRENTGDIAMISPSTTSTCLTSTKPLAFCGNTNLRPKNGVTSFRTAALDTTEGAALADYLLMQHYTQAYIIEDTGIYGQDLAQGFGSEWSKKTGVPPTTAPAGPLSPTRTSPSTYQKAIDSFPPEDPAHSVIFYAGNTPTATLIYALIERNTQLRGVAFAAGGGVINASFATDIERARQSGPIYAIAPVGRSNDQQIDANLDFYSRYLSSYNDRPTLYSASAYDCAQIVIAAIKNVIEGAVPGIPAMTPEAQKFRSTVIAAIQGISYDGITDYYTFVSTGDTKKQTVSLYQLDMQSQQWEYIPYP